MATKKAAPKMPAKGKHMMGGMPMKDSEMKPMKKMASGGLSDKGKSGRQVNSLTSPSDAKMIQARMKKGAAEPSSTAVAAWVKANGMRPTGGRAMGPAMPGWGPVGKGGRPQNAPRARPPTETPPGWGKAMPKPPGGLKTQTPDWTFAKPKSPAGKRTGKIVGGGGYMPTIPGTPAYAKLQEQAAANTKQAGDRYLAGMKKPVKRAAKGKK